MTDCVRVEIRFSSSRSRVYFYNSINNSSVWETPNHLTQSQVLALPGAHLLQSTTTTTTTTKSTPSNKVKASHLLIKHSQSRRPASWKQDKITRTVIEATTILKAHQKELNQLNTHELQIRFSQLATTESDCSSAKQAGDLG